MRGACAPRRFSAQARCRNLASERASNHLFTHAKHAQLSDSRGLVGQLWTAGTPVAKERVSRMQAVRSSATRSATNAMRSASGVLLLTLDLDRGCLRFRTRFSDVCQGWPAVDFASRRLFFLVGHSELLSRSNKKARTGRAFILCVLRVAGLGDSIRANSLGTGGLWSPTPAYDARGLQHWRCARGSFPVRATQRDRSS